MSRCQFMTLTGNREVQCRNKARVMVYRGKVYGKRGTSKTGKGYCWEHYVSVENTSRK